MRGQANTAIDKGLPQVSRDAHYRPAHSTALKRRLSGCAVLTSDLRKLADSAKAAIAEIVGAAQSIVLIGWARQEWSAINAGKQ